MIDPALLTDFEARLDPARPLAPELGASIIGYGEISTVFTLAAAEGVVLKRMAGFREPEVAPYVAAVERYCRRLAARGVEVVPTACVPVARAPRHPVVYVVQAALPAGTIGHRVVRDASDDEVRDLLAAVIDRIALVFSDHPDGARVGLDAQISNWAWVDGRPVYLDVSTPLMRAPEDGFRECLDPNIALRSMPLPLAWVFKRWALQSVLDRYYDVREVIKDIAANFIKEGRPDRVPLALTAAAPLLSARNLPRLEADEVARYYRGDARIWRWFQRARRADRWWTTRALRRPYDYILPG